MQSRSWHCRLQANSHPAPPGESDIQRLAERLSHLRLDMWEMVGDGKLPGAADHIMK